MRTMVLAVAALSCAGCQIYRNLGTGVHYDAPQPKVTSDKGKRVHDILVAVTTNAAGAVTLVQFKRSSGSGDIDQYIADTARQGWRGAPSTTSLIELTYSGEKGFSDPKVISTTRAP